MYIATVCITAMEVYVAIKHAAVLSLSDRVRVRPGCSFVVRTPPDRTSSPFCELEVLDTDDSVLWSTECLSQGMMSLLDGSKDALDTACGIPAFTHSLINLLGVVLGPPPMFPKVVSGSRSKSPKPRQPLKKD
jgi:hypothetical protein